MSQFTRQFYGRTIDLGLQAEIVIEPFKLTGLGGSIDRIQDPPVPPRGKIHPDGVHYPGMVLDRVRLRNWINRDTAIVDLIYRRQITGYRGGPRAGSRTTITGELLEIPVQKAYTMGGVIVQYARKPVRVTRAVTIRVETRFLTSPSFNAIQDAVTSSIGKMYTIGGLQMIFMGANTRYDGIGSTVVEYQFWRNAQVLAYGAGSDVPIPPLPPFYQYEEGYAADGWTPAIGTKSQIVFTPVGLAGSLPGL